MSRICKQEEALSDIQILRNICYATFFILVLMISANMVSPSCSKFCQLKRKKNFAQSASDGTAGECSVKCLIVNFVPESSAAAAAASCGLQRLYLGQWLALSKASDGDFAATSCH